MIPRFRLNYVVVSCAYSLESYTYLVAFRVVRRWLIPLRRVYAILVVVVMRALFPSVNCCGVFMNVNRVSIENLKSFNKRFFVREYVLVREIVKKLRESQSLHALTNMFCFRDRSIP